MNLTKVLLSTKVVSLSCTKRNSIGQEKYFMNQNQLLKFMSLRRFVGATASNIRAFFMPTTDNPVAFITSTTSAFLLSN